MSLVISERTCGVVVKQHQMKSILDITKKFFTEKVTSH